MESLRRLTSSIFDGESRLGLGRRGSLGNGLLSPNSEAAAVAAQRFAPSDLDITFITNRLIVMGFPVQGPTDKKRNENNIDDLAEYLETHHSNQYLIFNLNSLEDDCSAVQVQDLDSFVSSTQTAAATTVVGDRKQTSAIAEKVRQQMVEFSWERDGMKAHTPAFDHIFRICYAIFAWLSLDASNVALINCQTGKTRSGIVVASYLLYARLAEDPIEAFVEFYKKRWDMKSLTADALRQKTPQSVQRFLSCFHDLIENQRIPNEAPLLLKGIMIRAVPVEYQPCVQIWDDYRLAFCTSDGPQVATEASQAHQGPAISWDCEEGCLAIFWDEGLDLDGGFSIMCSFGDEYDIDETNIDPSSKVLFRYADSTWFQAPGLIALPKSKLDIMKQYEEAFNEEHFSMDLIFVESKKPKRKHVPIDCTGNAAVRQGIIEITKQHLVLPDPGMHSNFMKMGFSDAATTFALQRSQNAPNVALDLLHSSVIMTCFGQVSRPSDQSRPALQSYSSASLLAKQPRSVEKPVGPLVRRQSTAEIAALQSQRGRYSTPAAEASTTCSKCKEDDYMMRPQIVRCTGPCGNFYHTTCVGLKRIPFGLTTLSDRTNHAVYVKKYFNAWECDLCTASYSVEQNDPPPNQQAMGTDHRPVTSRQPGSNLSKDTSRSSPNATDIPSSDGSIPTSSGASKHVDDEKMDKLKEFLATSGVSVEDLLRAATTANVTISPSAGAVELPKTLEQTTDKPSSPSSSALHKLFASGASALPERHENPQDSAPKQDVPTNDKGRCSQTSPQKDTTESDNDSKSKNDSLQVTQVAQSKPDHVSAVHNDIKRPQSPAAEEKTEEGSRGSSLTEPNATSRIASSTQKVIPSDPKAALLAQIAARSQSKSPTSSSDIRATGDDKCKEKSTSGDEPAKVDSMKKYQLMLQRGVPFEAVQNCMKKDGEDPSRLVAVVATEPKTEREETGLSGTRLKDMSEFSSYFNMLRLGCPKPAVKQKMLMDGSDPVVLDLGPDAIYEDVKNKIKMSSSSETSTLQDDIKSVKSHKKVVKPKETSPPVTPTDNNPTSPSDDSALGSTAAEVALKDHEVYSKYFKMLKMGLPEDAVRHKIQRDGLDVRALELGADAPYSKLIEKPAEVRLADDPLYSKFFKMLKMGLPKDAVLHKMVMENADTRALELGPDAFLSQLGNATAQTQTGSSSKPIKPKARRKKLHWQPISDDRLSSANRQTIWEDKDDEGMEFDMDMAEIESLFFASSDNGKKKASGVQAKSLKRKQSVTLIDGKRAMNAAISLARVKLSYAEIAHAISVFDAKGLTVEQLRGIRDFLPTAEEVALVSNYGGDLAILGEAEKFIMEICKVKRYTMRTECLLFRMSFVPRHQELSASLDHLINACQQVKESRLLKILLSMVLKLGNTLNGSGDDNEIRGFTVDSLLRLGHTKAVNQKTTVLHYLIRLVKKNHPAVLDFQSELKSVPQAARESFESIDEDFGKLQAGLTQLSEEFQELQKDEMDTLTQVTVASLQEAVEDIGGQMELLDQRIKRARDEVQSVLEYFGEDPAKNLSSFFTTLSSFCGMFESARKEVDAADEAQLRAERVKMRRNASMRPNPSASTSTSARGVRIDRERAMSDRGFMTTTPRISEDDIGQ